MEPTPIALRDLLAMAEHTGRRYYAGVGSRETPLPVLNHMAMVADALRKGGLILRTGGARGADIAFEQGAFGVCEVFLPWAGYRPPRKYDIPSPAPEAFDIAARFHPAWDSLSDSVRKLMARNAHQILGRNLDSPVAFVLCWTPDGADGRNRRTSQATGGTGQAIRIATAHDIPVFNLQACGSIHLPG